MAVKQLESAGVDLLGEMVWVIAEALMCAEINSFCMAPYGHSGAERVNYRNGYRGRRWTRGWVGST